MAALNLHYAIFTNEKTSDLPLRSASSFLHSAPERDESPTSRLFSSSAYQDLVQRQPTHPDGPMSGWDLGLNLLGDPMTATEHRSLENYQLKMKLRRLHAINVAFELLFGAWGTYTTIRYFLAFVDGLDDSRRICALVLGITSALVVALVTISVSIPFFPRHSSPDAWRHARSFFRACYLLLLSAGAAVNFILVLVWHPTHFCHWDIDISWYTSPVNTVVTPCHPSLFAAWIAAATLRLVVTWVMVLSFIYVLRSYREIRHPAFERSGPRYSAYSPTDLEDLSPVSASSPLHLLKSTLRLTQSEDSDHTLNQSNVTLPKSNSLGTLTPSTSCTGHSRSRSAPFPKDISPPKISPSMSRRSSVHVTHHGPTTTQFRSGTPPQTQAVSGVMEPSSVPHMLRRMSRISVALETSDPTRSDMSTWSEGSDGQTTARDPSEIPSSSCKHGHRGPGAHLDIKTATLAWESGYVRNASHASVGSSSFSSAHDGSESAKEKDRATEDLVYAYGYGASGPTYPYLDMYNPQGPERYPETLSSCEDVDEHGVLGQGYRRAIALPDATSERSSLTREESSGEEEEYVAMMGGFVRRMATIESLGSKEGAGTLSPTGSVARLGMRSKTPASQFSSVRFAGLSSFSGTSSSAMASCRSREASTSTVYLSFSSGGTGRGARVNERGELLRGPGFHNANKSSAGSRSDRHYYTASGNSFWRVEEEEA